MVAPAAGPSQDGQVRVSVASATRRADLALAGRVPVAELVPELARTLGLLDAATAAGGHRVLAASGRVLDPGGSLLGQGVADGALLRLVPGEEHAPRRYDDVAEAVGDVVDQGSPDLRLPVARGLALAAALLSLTAAAGALATAPDPSMGGIAAVGLALALLAGAAVLSRVEDARAAGGAALTGAVGYAAVAGLLLAGPALGSAVAGAGAGAACAGIVGVAALDAGRAWALVPLLLGGLAAGAVALARVTDAAPDALAALLLAGVVLAVGLLPRLALGLLTGQDPRAAEAGAGIDLAGLRRDVVLAHEILLVLLAAAGLAVALLAPLAATGGRAGTGLGAAGCLVLVLRARHHRVAVQALATGAPALVGLLATAVVVLRAEPEQRAWTTLVLVLAGAGALLAGALAPGSVRRGRLGDVAETGATVALLPLLVLAVLPGALGV